MLDALEPFAATPGSAQALRKRLRSFLRAMRAGGPRERYESWKASCEVLIAALEIIAEPAEAGGLRRIDET